MVIFWLLLYEQNKPLLAQKVIKLLNNSEQKNAESFLLTATGECQFNQHEPMQLSAKSQINLWGYWLIFAASKTNQSACFIFKDSLSSQDQARIARAIIRIQRLP